MSSNRRLTTQQLADWIVEQIGEADPTTDDLDDYSNDYLETLDELAWEIIDKVLANYGHYKDTPFTDVKGRYVEEEE